MTNSEGERWQSDNNCQNYFTISEIEREELKAGCVLVDLSSDRPPTQKNKCCMR